LVNENILSTEIPCEYKSYFATKKIKPLSGYWGKFLENKVVIISVNISRQIKIDGNSLKIR